MHDLQRIFFEGIYCSHWKKLYLYALKFTGDPQVAEDLTQEVFLYFLEMNEEKEINNPAAYLLSALRYQCFNWQRNNRVSEEHLDHVRKVSPHSTENDVNYLFTVDDIKRVVSDMPDKYREVFELSRFENLPSDEIAEKLAINKRTVENRLSGALRILRVSLRT